MKSPSCLIRRLLSSGMVFLLFTPVLARAEGVAADYLGPSELVATRDGGTLIVACTDARQVLWVDVEAEKVTRQVSTPAPPTGLILTPAEDRLIVTCADSVSPILVIDLETGETLQSMVAGHTAMSPVLNPDGTRLYVCNRFDGDVSVVDINSGEQLRRAPMVREPISAALTPDGAYLVVANHLANMRTNVTILDEVTPAVSLLDTRTFERTDLFLPSGSNGLRNVCVSPDGKHAFVTHLLSNFQELPFRVTMGWINTNVLSIIDVPGKKVLSTIGLDEMDLGSANPWDVTVTADGQSVCVSLAGTHELASIDLTLLLSEESRLTMSPMMGVWPIYLGLGDSYWHRTALEGKGPRGIASAGSDVFVAEYFSDTISVVRVQDGKDRVLKRIALGPPPKLTPQRQGELLFHDAMICEQRWQSCSSCHPDGRTDSLNWDLMNDGTGNPKNTKSLLLSHQTPPAMAEGVRAGAEVAVRSGIANILFTDRPESEAIAIDEYLRSLQAAPSPHLVDGGLSESAERGRELFHSARIGCFRCHPGPLYTDGRIHNVGSKSPKESNEDFDTPTLVEIWRTAPYLHDGRYMSIEDLLTEGRHGLRKSVQLSDKEMQDLTEYVLSL